MRVRSSESVLVLLLVSSCDLEGGKASQQEFSGDGDWTVPRAVPRSDRVVCPKGPVRRSATQVWPRRVRSVRTSAG